MRYNEPLTSALGSDRFVVEEKRKVKPVLSVIVPVYQEEKILSDQLGLFTDELRKKYSFELIVSDGGSTDNTVAIAKEFADKVVVHNEDRRQTISEGRNNGAKAAIGETLIFINADTVPKDMDSFLKLLLIGPKNEQKYSAIACYVWAFPDEIILKDKIFYTFHNAYVHFLNNLGLGMGRGECQVVRKQTFEKVNGYNDSIVAGEDFDLYRRIAAVGKINFSKDLVVFESPRRFRKYGYFKTVTYWMLNSLSVMIFGKSVSKEWEAVR